MECQMRRYHKNSNGFTMAEMLITVAIIVILCGFGFVAVIAHQRNLKRMEMDETAQEIFIAAQNHLTAARASGQWSSFLEKTAAEGQDGSRGTAMTYQPSDYNKASDADEASRKFYYFTTENTAVKNGAEALILPEGSIDETLRGHHFYVEYDAASGTVFGVFYTDSDHAITAGDAQTVSRTDPDARRDYKADGKRTIIGYYGGALGELNSPGDLYAPSVAVRNAESLVLYVVDKNYYRPVSSKTGAQNFKTKLKLTFEGVTSRKKAVKEVDPSSSSSQTDALFNSAVLAEESEGTFNVVIPSSGASAQQTKAVKAEYYAIVLDSIVRKDGHFANLFPEFIPGEDIRITVTLTSDKAGEDVSQTVTVNSLFNSVKTEKNGITASKTVVTVSNPRHLENLSSEVSGVDFAVVKDTTVDTVSVVRNLFWDEDAEAENVAKAQNQRETVTAFLPAIASATGMKSDYGYNAGGTRDAAAITKENLQVYPYSASGTENAANSSGNSAPTPAAEGENLITKGSCYGITNTAIKSFEGNNHILAAFRFEGKKESALINRAAAAIKVSDLVIADSTSCVTGEIQDSDQEVPTAALLIAKANSGYAGNDNSASVENVQIIWYQNGANKDGITTGNSKVTTAPKAAGTMVYSESGIASLLIGSVDANHKLPDEEGKTPQQGTRTNKFTIKNATIQAGDFGMNKTANVGVEGNIAAGMIGEIKSGAVTIGNSDDQTENWKTNIKINGTLTLNAVKEENSVAGGLIGKVADTASSSDDAVTLQKVYLEATTLTMNGSKDKNNSILGGLIGSVAGGKSIHVENADLIAKSVNGGVGNNQELNAGITGGIIGSVTAGTKTTLKNIRFTSAESRLSGKQAAGGVIGSLASGEASLESVNVLATNKNEVEGESQSTVKHFRDIKVASSDNASLTINADTGSDSAAGGLIGNVSGQASNLNITKSSVKTVTADDKDVNLTVTGANIGGLIGICGSAATTIGGDAASEVVLTVQGNFALGRSAQAAGNAGGLIGKIGQNGNTGNITATIQNVPLTARTMHAYAAGDNNGNGTVGGFVGYVATGSSSVSLSSCNLSANSIDLGERETNNSTNTVKAAGGAVGKISAGAVSLSNLTVLTPKAGQDAGEGANDNYIRVIADRGTAGGLVGVAENGTTRLEISNAAISGSGANDQIEAGGSAGGLVGDSKAGQMSITNSMASMYVQTDGITNVTDSSTGAGGLVGSASGTVTIQNSYSGGRTTRANDPEKAADSSTAKARYVDSASGQGRYNVYLNASNGAAGGLIGYYAGSNLNVDNSYSTSSVAVSKINNNTYVGGFIGEADNLTARNTYCIGRVYENLGTGASTSTEKGTTTPRYGTYVGKIGSFSAQSQKNYYLKGMKGAPAGVIGTLNGSSQNITIAENILTGADYYDNNCPLKQGAASGQRSYYFDTALTGNPYPFKTYTAAYARTLYDPNTGEKVENADADSSKYAQIGDWEIPAEESTEGTYGLIYYERVWDGTANSLDPTFYYHGYILESGENAKSATYKEIHSSEQFVTDIGKYVSESGYLLLINKNTSQDIDIGFGKPFSENENDKKVDGAGLRIISLDNSLHYSIPSNCGELAAYNAYDVTLSVQKMGTNVSWFRPYTKQEFGTWLTVRKKVDGIWAYGEAMAAFTYSPFFADALQPADEGMPKSVSKHVEGDDMSPDAVIRSAEQLKYLTEYENKDNCNSSFLQGKGGYVIEQEMDISYDFNTARMTYEGVELPIGNDVYLSSTFNTINGRNIYRGSEKKENDGQKRYCELYGLTSRFASDVYGEICDLNVTNIRADSFVNIVSRNKEVGDLGNIQNITINDAKFGKGTNNEERTEGGFANSIRGEVSITNCRIINASIYGNGFVQDTTEWGGGSIIRNCYIINATILGNGFIQNNGSNIENCGVYADEKLYLKGNIKNYQPLQNNHGTYDYVSIGVASDGTKNKDNIAGFVSNQSIGARHIQNCFMVGTVYGSEHYVTSGFVGTIANNLSNFEVKNSYANVVLSTDGDASGFIMQLGVGNGSTISGCYALGVIENAKHASGLVASINGGKVLNCYTAFWNIKAENWYPFYKVNSNAQTLQNNFYLSEYTSDIQNGDLVDYTENVKGISYQQLCNQTIDGLQKSTQANTKGYYRYMDQGQQIYPYPMPAGMTAYGDWSHADPDNYTLLYYEKVDGKYYFHGYSTEDGESYTELATSGDNVQHGLVAAADQKAEDDGYILIAGTNSSWSTFGRADNSGTVSSPVNNANTQVFKPVASSNTELLKALENLQGLKKKNTDKIYIFQPEQYLNYADATKNFAAWRTLTQESEGIGISVYSTKGAIPMAKFSFQPFFADTVKQPNVVSQGTSNRSEISFVTTKDEDPDYDYRIRSLRQLQALSDWDAGIWNKKENVADAQTLKQEFDQKTRRYSYLSTSSENYENHLKIRQDLDINVGGANISFARIDGTYVGKKYDNRSVMLQELRYDFAKQIASTGKICSLVIDQAKLDGLATTSETSGDIAHGGQKEFVEYNYGSISDITVQNSKLGSAGLVYQNGNASKDALKKEIYEPQEGAWGTYVENLHLGNEYKNAYRYEITIHYLEDTNAEIGSIQNCIITNSKISGAGIVWKNIGGSITDSCVQNCVSVNGIGHAGFVEYNQATVINNVPETRTEYVYLLNERWNKENQQKVPEEIVQQRQQANQNGWFMNSDSQKQISVFGNATIKNCFVSDCNIRGNGFVGENSIYTQGNNSGGQAKISNCQVYGTSSYSDVKIGSPSGASDVNKVAGFVGNNGKGAEIENCSVTGQVGGRKNVAGFVLTNAGTITGSYANTKIACEENQGTMLSGFVLTNTGTIDRSHSLGEESCKQVSSGADNQAAGFVVNNQKTSDSSTNAVIRNSYAAMWKLELNGTEYVPFGSKDNSSGAGSYDNCYAMKLSAGDGYSGTYLAASAPGITYVSGEDLQKKCNDDLGNAAEDGKTTAYQAELKSTKYPFPCGSMIMNYGDWKLTDGNSAATHTITLAAGCKAVFPEDVVRSLSADAAVMAASDDGNTENADEAAITGTENAYGQDSIPEEDRHEVQLELGEEEETLDLAELVPVRKGWKFLGWLITSPSELSASEKTTTVSDVVTKINKLSDGDAEASGSSKAVYELETGTKSYHYAPDAVITVTEDMTLSAVWVPDDDTVEKAKDGTLRMDENGNILDGEEQVTNEVTNETTETDSDASAADTSSAVTGDDTDGMTSENQDASTDQTADASGTLPVQNTEDDMSEMSDLTAESDPEMETSPETTGEEGEPAGEK